MILELWTFINPILRLLIYATALISIGTVLFSLHFKKYFDDNIYNYCNKILKNNSFFGAVASIFVFFSIAGNLGGDIKSIFELSLVKLSFETLQAKSTSLLFIGFILLYFSTLNTKYFPEIVNMLGTIILLISFIIIGHSFSSGIISQFLIFVHVFCISYWVGSFFPLRYMCTINNYKKLFTIAHNFGVYAVVYISLLIVTGLIFSYILLGGIQQLITSVYGNVLLIKILFVSIILFVGAINKFKIVPLIKIDHMNGQHKLKKSIEIELTLTFFVLFFTSILTTSLTTPLGV